MQNKNPFFIIHLFTYIQICLYLLFYRFSSNEKKRKRNFWSHFLWNSLNILMINQNEIKTHNSAFIVLEKFIWNTNDLSCWHTCIYLSSVTNNRQIYILFFLFSSEQITIDFLLFSLIDMYLHKKRTTFRNFHRKTFSLCYLRYITKNKSSGQCWLPKWNSSCHSHLYIFPLYLWLSIGIYSIQFYDF